MDRHWAAGNVPYDAAYIKSSICSFMTCYHLTTHVLEEPQTMTWVLHMLPERTYDVLYPIVNELGYGFNRDVTTRRTLNNDMHLLPNFDRRNLNVEGFPVNDLRFILSEDGTKIFLEEP